VSFVLDKIGALVTLEGAVEKKGRFLKPQDLGIISEAALVIEGTGLKSKVAWVGQRTELPKKYSKLKKVSARGQMVLPGFVDSHTHLVFAGDRSHEFEMRLAGKSYLEIAQAGGGIINSVKATREMSEKDLFKLSSERVETFLKQGVTTLEIKTGYGLSFESEKKCLKVIDKLKRKTSATIRATFLAAHALPMEFKESGHKAYIQEVAHDWLPKLKNYIDFVDIFLDKGYFAKEDAAILFQAAQSLKIATRIHADELALTGGSETAVSFGSLSADHLLKIGEKEMDMLAKSEVTATLLPTTAFFLNEPYGPARGLLDRGARVALATDFNPGTSPTQDVSLVGSLAALQMKMSIEEILVALTLNGAYALGLQNQKGALLPGYDADFILIEAKSPARLFYEFGRNWFKPKVFCKGKFIA
jgi:imidazolonepropionase